MEDATKIPIKADAISIVICPAAFVNIPTGMSVLSYSMHIILVPAAIIFAPTRPSVDARPFLQAILKVSLVDFSIYKCHDSLAMRHII